MEEKQFMRILQLCKKFPYPLKDGESIAVTNLSKALCKLDCEVTLLAMNTSKHYSEPGDLPADYDHYKAMHFARVDNRLKPWDAFKNLFSKESYHISRFISEEYEAALINLLKKNEYDIIQLETLYLAPYISTIRKYSKATVSMRSHNVEHEIWQRITDNTSFLPKKKYLQYLTNKLRGFEVNALKDYDLMVPITIRDLETFKKLGYTGKAVVTPIGIDGKDYEPDWSSFNKALSLSFIGSLDWMPNQEGLAWFLDNIWSEVHEKFPKLKLHVAGRNTPKRMLEMKIPNVVFHGEVPCAKKFINQHSVMIVPLLSGSGMRAKILEGMALGKVVLTTSVGVEGIKAKNLQEILIADSVQEFIKQIEYCNKKKNMLSQFGEEAQELVHREYDNLAVARRILEAYSNKSILV